MERGGQIRDTSRGFTLVLQGLVPYKILRPFCPLPFEQARLTRPLARTLPSADSHLHLADSRVSPHSAPIPSPAGFCSLLSLLPGSFFCPSLGG